MQLKIWEYFFSSLNGESKVQLKTELEDGRAGGGHPILTPQVFVFFVYSCSTFPELNLIPGPGILM